MVRFFLLFALLTRVSHTYACFADRKEVNITTYWQRAICNNLTNRLIRFAAECEKCGLAQSNYYGPKPPPHFLAPPTTNSIRIQLEIYDDPALGGDRIQRVTFNKQEIPLQKADIHGFRGSAGFQVSPGTYDLRWEVLSFDNSSQQSTLQQHEQSVSISQQDEWVQITIQGEEASVN